MGNYIISSAILDELVAKYKLSGVVPRDPLKSQKQLIVLNNYPNYQSLEGNLSPVF